ncbi:MAG TPA: hypothetical protein VF132_14745 [Rudaea sp.]
MKRFRDHRPPSAIIILVASSGVFAAPAVHAVPQLPLLYCNSCSEAAKENLALDQPAGTKVYISDLVTQTVEAYSVTTDRDDSKSPPRQVKIADSIAPSEPYLSTAKAAIAFYHQAPIGWTKHLTLTTAGTISGTGASDIVTSYPDKTKNVYNVILPGRDQNVLTDWTKNSLAQFVNSAAENVISLAANFHIVDLSTVTKFVITVKFEDGSHVDIAVDYSVTNPRYSIDPKSGRDSHNNNVPTTREAATCVSDGGHGACTFDFDSPTGNPGDRSSWATLMTMLGVGVGAGSSAGGHWACTSAGEGASAVYSCQEVP